MTSHSAQFLKQSRLQFVPGDGVDGRRPRVVIVGTGFAGLSVAKRLAKAPVDITLIDREKRPGSGLSLSYLHLIPPAFTPRHCTRRIASNDLLARALENSSN